MDRERLPTPTEVSDPSGRHGAVTSKSKPGSLRSSLESLRAKTRIFTVIVVLSNAFGNFAMARGMRGRVTASALDYLVAIFTPWVMLGIILLIVWLLSRMALMSWADLSYVLPVTSIGYVASAIIGRFLLNEQITPARWAGTLLVVAGAVLVGRGAPHSKGAL
jgi:drug/metabolite transporter (DMT)-like permease